MTAAQRREAVTTVREQATAREAPLSERQGCRYLGLHRSPVRYRSRRASDAGLREQLRALAAAKPRWGYRRLHWQLQRDGVVVNHKRLHRLYRAEGLAVRRRKRKRVAQPRIERSEVTAPNQRWSMDFVRDTLSNGRVFRALTIVDEYTRERLHIEIDTSLPGLRVVRVLDQLALTRGLPQCIVVDNGPGRSPCDAGQPAEFAGRVLDEWAHRRGVAITFIQPGKPTQNCYIESFNGRLRDECQAGRPAMQGSRPNMHWFLSLADARRHIQAWRTEYNDARPHSGLAGCTPSEFAAKHEREALVPPPLRLSA